MDYSDKTTDKLKFMLWANLQDNLHRRDILDRSSDPSNIKRICEDIKEAEKTISAIREELIRRGA